MDMKNITNDINMTLVDGVNKAKGTLSAMESLVPGESLINSFASDMLLKAPIDTDMPFGMIKDNQWRKQAFITATEAWVDNAFVVRVNLDQQDYNNRSFSTASVKYTDSSLGGNFCINPPPQFTRYADIRDPGLRKSNRVTTNYSTDSIGIGRYYSEAIDDNSQLVHIRFGVPQYNSLWQFFTGFYDSSASKIARTGRMDDSFLTKFLGFAKAVITVAILPLAIVPMGIMALGMAYRFFVKWPSSKFYYIKPTMPLYWQAVTSMLNQIGVNKGVIHYSDANEDSVIGRQHRFTDTDFSIFNAMFPEFKKSGRIDVYAIANKAKRLEMRHRNALQEQYNAYQAEGGNNPDAWYGRVRSFLDNGAGLDMPSIGSDASPTLESFIQKWIDSLFGKAKGDKDSAVETDIRQSNSDPNLSPEERAAAPYASKDKPDGYLDFANAQLADGGEWATFRVDYTGPASESFGSSAGESTLAQKLNGYSGNARNLRVNFADMNFDSLGAMKFILDTAGAVVQGVADMAQIGGLAAFAGNAFVDIPKHWESSTTTLNKSTYTMTLISPYGNPISQLFSIYMPLCMLLAGALPLSTGKQSYTSPFMCEIYDRGRSITRLGMIESLSIQRGTSNLGFNNEGQPMAIDVSFSILDMSTIVSMPIEQGFSILKPFEGIFDTDNAFTDYLMTLSSLSLRDAEQRFPVIKNQLAKKAADIGSFFSASHFGAVTANLPGVNLIGALMRGVGARSATGG